MKKRIFYITFYFIVLLVLSFNLALKSQTKVNKEARHLQKIIFKDFLFSPYGSFKKDDITSNTSTLRINNTSFVVDSVTGKDLLGNKFKAIYQYDNMGNIILDLRQNWDGSQFVNNNRTTHTFNSSGRRTMRLFENWDGTNWVSVSRETHTYDSNGNETIELTEDWDGSAWVGSSRWTTNYDSQGEPVLEINEDWNGSGWVKDWRQTVTYESNGDLIVIEEDWNGSSWVNDSRNTNSFDNGHIILQLYEEWDGSNWVNIDRTSLTYDSNGRNTSLLTEYWDGSNWINSTQYTYSFNSDGMRTSFLTENWNGTQWENENRISYTYDPSGNNTESLTEEWDGSQWVSQSRATYSYDSNRNVTSGLSEIWDGSSWIEGAGFLSFSVEGPFGLIFYSFLSSQINIYYRTVATDISENNEVISNYNLSQNYPNPFNPSTVIEYSIPKDSYVEIKVFDILGNEVATLVNEEKAAGIYKVNFWGNNLSSGIYFTKINAQNYTKIIKMNLLK